MSQELSKREEDRSMTIPTEGAVGLTGQFGEQDITLPVCSLTQPMSQDKGEEGRFWFPDGRSLEDMRVVVLDIVATRALWGPVDSGIGAPICRSIDRKMGLTNYVTFIEKGGDVMQLKPQDAAYVDCQTCRFGPSATSFEKIDGLWCPFGYTLLLCFPDTEEAFLYFVKGSQMKSIRQRIVSPAIMRYQRTGKPTPWAVEYYWKPRLVEEKDKKRKYWKADIQALRECSDQERDRFAALALAYRGRAAQQMEDEDLGVPEEEGQGELV